MRSNALLAVLAALNVAVCAQDAAAAKAKSPGPPFASASLVSLEASGNGCPKGAGKLIDVKYSNATETTPAWSWLLFDLTGFAVGLDPGTASSEHCKFHLDLDFASNVAVSPFAVEYNGNAFLEENVTATFTSTFSVGSGAGHTQNETSPFQGGGTFADPGGWEFILLSAGDSETQVWSSCGGNSLLTVDMRIGLESTRPNATGTVSLEKLNNDTYTSAVILAWAPCFGT